MTILDVLATRDAVRWQRTLDLCAPYDFYHLPQYHALAEESGEGMASLFVYQEDGHTIALPLLLRDVPAELQAPGWRDATSVYGYVGPVRSARAIPESIVKNFQTALTACLRRLKVVSVFSRLHPFHTLTSLLDGLGERRVSQTVSIDLTLDPAVQRAKYRKSQKEKINKLRRLGVTVVHDQDGTYLNEFARIYEESMHRVEAWDRYFYSPAYFQRLRELLGSYLHLFMCLHEGRPISGGMVGACHGIIQNHLAGTLNDAVKLSPLTLLVDEIRHWGIEQKLRVLHLGGGMSSDPEDSLLHFKQGFSDRTHDFAVWRWILTPDIHAQLCAAKNQWNERHLQSTSGGNFFPEYRAPTIPCALAVPENLPLWSSALPQVCS